MNWFIAKIVFRIICGDGQHTAQFDEQLRLLAAASPEEAFRKAVETGQQEEDSFFNKKQQLVQWQFVNVSELFRLSEFTDGAELHSRIEEKENAGDYIEFVHNKAAQIQNGQLNTLLQLV
ncbi:MAG TPA: DUF4288 domain-containing protein [Chitinophagaceae bacterium]|jgi:hypothetical protein|nr:DUF4288 domain-containing protein [Chitinophagaceae bacterium]